MSSFRPRCFTHFNCQLSHLWLRKWRGLRRRGRAALLAKRAACAKLTDREVDFLVQATLSRRVKSTVHLLDRVRTPFAKAFFRGMPLYKEEMT